MFQTLPSLAKFRFFLKLVNLYNLPKSLVFLFDTIYKLFFAES